MLFNEDSKQEAVVRLAGAEVTDVVFYFNTDGSLTLGEERYLRLLFAVLQTGFAKSLSVRDGTVQLNQPLTHQKENPELLTTTLLHNDAIRYFARHFTYVFSWALNKMDT